MPLFHKIKYVVHTAGDPVLKQKAQTIEAVTPEIRELAAYMLETVRAFKGLGIAAPQVGKSLRLVVFDIPLELMSENPSIGEQLLLPKMPLTVVNPEIVFSSNELAEQDEGCLSVPDIWAPVVRPASVLFKATTLEGEAIECECAGLLGRCIQHELDHLEGVLFVDRVSPAAAKTIERDLKHLIRYGEKHHFHRTKSK